MAGAILSIVMVGVMALGFFLMATLFLSYLMLGITGMFKSSVGTHEIEPEIHFTGIIESWRFVDSEVDSSEKVQADKQAS